jgi:hypothetical protein
VEKAATVVLTVLCCGAMVYYWLIILGRNR